MSFIKRTTSLTSLLAAGVMVVTVSSAFAGHRPPVQHPSHWKGAPASGISQSPITSQSTGPGNRPSNVPNRQ